MVKEDEKFCTGEKGFMESAYLSTPTFPGISSRSGSVTGTDGGTTLM